MNDELKYNDDGPQSVELKRALWDQAYVVDDHSPDLYREDPMGNVLYWHNYGKNTAMGWGIDHILPKCYNGSNKFINLQVMQTEAIGKSQDKFMQKKTRYRNHTVQDIYEGDDLVKLTKKEGE